MIGFYTIRSNQNKLSSSLTTFLNSFPRLTLVTYLYKKWRQIKFAVILVALKLISNDDGLIKIEHIVKNELWNTPCKGVYKSNYEKYVLRNLFVKICLVILNKFFAHTSKLVCPEIPFFMRLFFYLRVKMTKFYIRVRKMIWLCKCLINR